MSQQDVKTLSLVKGRQHFCFRYEVGEETKVLDALERLSGVRAKPSLTAW